MPAEEPKDYVPKKPGVIGVMAAAIVIAALCVTAAGLVLARNSQLRHQAAQIELALAQGPRVLVTPVQMAPRQRVLEIPGSATGHDQSPVYAKLPGYMKAIYVDKGDRVKRGQLLALLESPETDKQVAQAQADYELQRVTDARNQRLAKLGVLPRQTADESKAAMLRAHALLAQLKAMQAYETIRSPFDGMVTERNADPGTLIPESTATTGARPLLVVETLKPLRIYAQVPQSQALFIRDGDKAVVAVTELPRRRFVGSVTRHSKSLTDATRTMLVEVDLPNEDLALYPGMYAKIEVTLNAPAGVPLAPDGALVFKHGKTYVPVVRQGHLHLIEVTLGYDDGQNVQILSGLNSDDVVALNMGQAAQDGEPVQPVLQRLD
ncbi:MAG TPA: efflux RND transporter periplasmic adaptor subunit [Candidatus Binataceae bacterium]|jgi:membrane fusion protein (multidrug efflux system)|nr:efflux RND transporter periplasmic adaptor subunit [Candidatus Binataceae bacterium]